MRSSTRKRKVASSRSKSRTPQKVEKPSDDLDDVFDEIMSEQRASASRKESIVELEARMKEELEKSEAQIKSLEKLQRTNSQNSIIEENGHRISSKNFKQFFKRAGRKNDLILFKIPEGEVSGSNKDDQVFAFAELCREKNYFAENSHILVSSMQTLKSSSNWNKWRDQPPPDLLQSLFMIVLSSRNIYAVDEARIAMKSLWSGINEISYSTIVAAIDSERHVVSSSLKKAWIPDAHVITLAFQHLGVRHEGTVDWRRDVVLKEQEDIDNQSDGHLWFLPNLRALLELSSFLVTNWPLRYSKHPKFKLLLEYSLRMCLDPLWIKFSFYAQKLINAFLRLDTLDITLLEDLVCGDHISPDISFKLDILLKLNHHAVVKRCARKLLQKFVRSERLFKPIKFDFAREWVLLDVARVIEALLTNVKSLDDEDKVVLIKLSHLSCGLIPEMKHGQEPYMQLFKAWRKLQSSLDMYAPDYSQQLDDILHLILMSHNALSHLHSLKGLYDTI